MLLSNSRIGDYLHLIWSWSKAYYWHSKVFFLHFVPWHSPWNRQRKKIKSKTLGHTLWLYFFQLSTSVSSVAIFQHQHMEITFYKYALSKGLFPETVIFWGFWTELSCSHKSYWKKVTLLLGWSHHYTNYGVVITYVVLSSITDFYLNTQCDYRTENLRQ